MARQRTPRRSNPQLRPATGLRTTVGLTQGQKQALARRLAAELAVPLEVRLLEEEMEAVRGKEEHDDDWTPDMGNDPEDEGDTPDSLRDVRQETDPADEPFWITFERPEAEFRLVEGTA